MRLTSNILIGWLLDELDAPTDDFDWPLDLSLVFDEDEVLIWSDSCKEETNVSDDCPSIHVA